MRKGFWFLCLFALSTLMPTVSETKADMAVPTWGEAIQNDCYLNIEILDSGFTIHQRIQMKLKKLVTDDYLYTFTTNSTNGEFDESSLSILAPPSGLKDSVFNHGCKLEYVSEIALEETLEVSFEYEYHYPSQELAKFYIRGG